MTNVVAETRQTISAKRWEAKQILDVEINTRWQSAFSRYFSTRRTHGKSIDIILVPESRILDPGAWRVLDPGTKFHKIQILPETLNSKP